MTHQIAHQAFLLGHSFVRRCSNDFGLYEGNIQTTLVGTAGNKPILFIKDIVQNRQEVYDWINGASTVVLIIGSNDLCSHVELAPEKIADSVLMLALNLRSIGIPRISIVEVLPRFGTQAFPKGHEAVWGVGVKVEDAEQHFEFRRSRFNLHIKQWVKAFPQEGVEFIYLRGLHQGLRSMMSDDLHLNGTGYTKFKAVIRKQVICDCHRALGWQVKYLE